ncbi:MAG: glycosyltransferase family 39 protein [Sandaracinaceae bacterium]|nr:glycosyltransferase family 39 protein [Sandaracinaceae bacterium]
MRDSERAPRAAEIGLSVAFAIAWVALARPGGIDLPYYWDEADVYVPGARWVAEHGLTVTPGVFPDDYSRGHPPLLYLLAGIAFALFGPSPAVGHLVVLPFTVLALAGTYLLGARLFGREAGAAAALLLGTTPLFLSIGNMLLPELPLTALAVLSFLALAHGRVATAAMLGVAAVLIKETGIFAAAGVGAAILFDAIEQKRLRASAGRIALATLPLGALGAFFVWQKAHAGYFVFPHHANLLADRPIELANVVTVVPSLLLWHGRWVVIAAALVATGVLFARPRAGLAPRSPSRRALLAGMLVVVLGNAAFFAKMFWLERYALPAHPLVLVAACGALFAFSWSGWRAAIPWAAVGAAALIGAASVRAPTAPDAEEQTFAYADVIATHQAAFATLGDEASVLTTWPMTVELRHAYLGYVARDHVAIDVQYLEAHADVSFTHAVVNSASTRRDDVVRAARARGMRRLGVHRVGVAPALEVWGR